MAYRRLSTLQLDEELKTKIAKAKLLTVKDVLSLAPLDMMNLLRLSADQCYELIDHLSSLCLPQHLNAYELSQSGWSISLGSSVLDSMLLGGLQAGSLTEFVGPQGVGKTQWCLQIAVMTVAERRGQEEAPSAIYVDTETAVRPERIMEIMSCRYPERSSEIPELLSKIHVFQPKTISSLSKIVDSLEVVVLEKEASVVIMDSVASLARKEFATTSTESRVAMSSQLASWAAKLKSLAHQINICVVATNQVTSRQVQESSAAAAASESSQDQEEVAEPPEINYYVIPALGNTWTHCVNTRFILQYTETTTRQLVIAKSPVSPFATFNYNIREDGISIKDNESFYSYSGLDPGLHKIKVQQGIPLKKS